MLRFRRDLFGNANNYEVRDFDQVTLLTDHLKGSLKLPLCPLCSAFISDQQKHMTWHETIGG